MSKDQNQAEGRTMTLEEMVADMARSVPHRSKKVDAFNALRRVIHSLEDAEAPDEVGLDLARLYAHFLPPLPKRPKTAFDWCAKAMAKNDVRHYLNFVHVTTDEIQATDGHRLHIAPNTDRLEPGYYGAEGVRLHAPEYSRFPDTQRVRPTPDREGRRWYVLAAADLKTGSMTPEKGNVLHWYELPTHDDESPQRVHINKAYLDALVSMDPSERVRFNVGGMGDSVLVELSGDRLAVLMPLRQ